MAVVELKRAINQRCVNLLKEALERVESGETANITLLEEGSDFSVHTNWTGSDDLLKVSGHLAYMQHIVQKRMEDY